MSLKLQGSVALFKLQELLECNSRERDEKYVIAYLLVKIVHLCGYYRESHILMNR
jgi:hypothetical protein